MAKTLVKKKKEEEVERVEFNALRWLLSTISHKSSLNFGINENCKLIKIDNTERKKEGEVVKKQTFLTFASYNSKGEVLGQNEFSYFSLDPDSEYTLGNLATQIAQLNNIAQTITGEAVSIDPVSGFKDEAALDKALKDLKSCKKIQEDMFDQFKEAVESFVGEECPLLRLKVVTEKSGKYLQLPKDSMVCELMSDPASLKITAYEYKQKDKALQPQTATPDADGDAPAKTTSKKAIINI